MYGKSLLALVVVALLGGSFGVVPSFAQTADIDADGVEDSLDNCPQVANPEQFDADADLVGDACDPYPATVLRVVPVAGRFGLTDAPTAVRYELRDQDDQLRSDLSGVRATLTLSNQAVFGTAAAEGTLLSGGGTARALVEFVAGRVVIDVLDAVPEAVTLNSEDSERVGLLSGQDYFDNFEQGTGGFTTGGFRGKWALGTPVTGPGSAYSGQNAWGTGLDGGYQVQNESILYSPLIELPAGSRPYLEYRSWFQTNDRDEGLVDISQYRWDWTSVDSLTGDRAAAGFELRRVDLSGFAGSTIQVRFLLRGLNPPATGWFVDDFAIRGFGAPLQFLDPTGDDDGDGLTNREELARGSDPNAPDSDFDGVGDLVDNCPATSNPDQADLNGDGTGDACNDTDDDGVLDGADNCVHLANPDQLDEDLDAVGNLCDNCPSYYNPDQLDSDNNGQGDACQDTDVDGLLDTLDNCAAIYNPDQQDSDGDQVGNACDPYPTIALRVMVRPRQFWAIAGDRVLVDYELVDQFGTRRTDLDSLQFTLSATGSARFDSSAEVGTVVSGGGSSLVIVSFAEGLLTLGLADAAVEVVEPAVLDEARVGVHTDGTIFFDFEQSSGGFFHSGVNDVWRWGSPVAGPGSAFSGLRAWFQELGPDDVDQSDARLISQPFLLRPGAKLAFQHWSSRDSYYFSLSIELSQDDGTNWVPVDELAVESLWNRADISLGQFAGPPARFSLRFRIDPEWGPGRGAWYIDDLELSGIRSTIRFLDPEQDSDGDGLPNQVEIGLGTDLMNPDSDGDLAADAIDNCPLISNPDQSDLINPNGIGDACDDADHDGLLDPADNCASVSNPDQADTDSDGRGDACDNCPWFPNAAQFDDDGNGLGDACSTSAGRPGIAHEPFLLPYHAVDMEFDGVRGRAYVADAEGKAIHVVNLLTGLTERTFRLDFAPSALALTPDGSRLFATLVTPGTYYYDDDHGPYPRGYVASLDLDRQLKDRQYEISADPYDVAATDDGILFVSSASDKARRLYSIDASSGATVSYLRWEYLQLLTWQPVGRRLYVSRDSEVYRYDIGAGGVLPPFSSANRRFAYDTGRMWHVPAQEILISRAGDRIVTSLDPQSDLRQSSRFVDPYRRAEFVAFDESRHVFCVAEEPFGVQPPVISQFNSVSYESFGQTSALNGIFRGLGFFGDQLIVAVENGSILELHRLPHPALEGDRNTPPVAEFSVAPATGGTTADLFVFDAAASQDAEHPESLLYRWDLDTDGTWDAPYSSNPTTTYRYATGGPHRATLSVKDHLGLIALRTREFSLQFTPDFGEPGVANSPFEFPFSARSAVFDEERGRAYLTDWDNQAVHFVDVTTGLIIRTFRFASHPDRLALSPDRKRLLVTLRAGHSSDTYPDPRTGNIGSFDLSIGALDRFCLLANNPYDVASIDEQRALVTTAGPGPLNLRLIDTRDCSTLSSATAHGTEIAMHPGLRRAYVHSDYYGTRGLARYDLSDVGQLVLTASDESFQTPQLWVSPSGDYLFGENGVTYASRDDAATDLESLESVSLEYRSILGVGFDTTRFVTAIVDGPLPQGALRLRYMNTLSRERFGPSTAFNGQAIGVGFIANQVGVLVNGDYQPNTSHLRLFPHPALDGASNPPPQPSLVIAPGSSGTTLDRFAFDASASTDDGSPGALRFRWDLDGDGTWDAPASLLPTAEWSFETAGRHTVRLRVIDAYGTAAETSAEVGIRFVPDVGVPAEPQQPWGLSFLPSDLAVDARGHRIYVADATTRRIVVFDLATGLPDRAYQFVSIPRRLSASADGRYLYVALDAPDASGPAPWKTHQGFIARFDLQARTKDRQVSIAEQPYDLVATRTGLVAVTPASRGEDLLRVFDSASGQLVGAVQGNGYRTTLLLDDSETRLYSVGSRHALRARLSQDGSVTPLWTLYRVFGSERETFVGPDRVLSMSGEVLQVTDDAATDLQPIGAVAECRNAFWDRQSSEFWTFMFNEARRYRSDSLELSSTVNRPYDFPYLVAKAGKLVLTVPPFDPVVRFQTFTFNHPPVANAGPDQLLECTANNTATASLDGRASIDTDSTPESNDDIKGFIWAESQQIIAGTPTADVTLSVGAHQLDLTVTDDSGASNTDSTQITVNDSIAPQGSIVFPAPNTCFGPAQLPVMLQDNVQDTCDPSFARRYDPPGAPGYSTHGDQHVALITTDASGNESSTSVPFTIDRVPPQVAIHPPPGGWRAPSSIPFRLVFTSTDDDGAAGAPIHELVLIDDCPVYDGSSFGDKDGVLSDEEVWIDDAAFCRAAATCGKRSWRDAIIAVRATDCGANEATGTTVLKGTVSLPPGGCR